MVGMRTRLAIERAGTVTPHLKRGAPVLYPNRRACRRNIQSGKRKLVWKLGAAGKNRAVAAR
jgi:hypothetical protein